VWALPQENGMKSQQGQKELKPQKLTNRLGRHFERDRTTSSVLFF
jgi:hypothetical protein